jgi:hypothetical protein
MALSDAHPRPTDDDDIEERSVHEDRLNEDYELPPPMTETEEEDGDDMPLLAASEYGETDEGAEGGLDTPSLSGVPPASMYAGY